MDVPLLVKSYIEDEKQLLEIWANGVKTVVEPPFLPYVVCKAPLTFQNVEPTEVIEFVGKPLSTLAGKKMWKYTFPNTKYISKLNTALDKSVYAMGNNKIPKLVCENHTEFKERVILDQPDYFRQYPNTNPLKFFFFDFETATKNSIDLKRIVSAAWATNDRVIHSIQSDNEKEILLALYNAFLEINPDISVGYNHVGFDWPYFFDRCIANGINYTTLGRDGHVDYYKKGFNSKVDIGGRIEFDVMNAVFDDQKLYGLKNRQMKTVAEYFGIPTIREDTKNTVDIPKDKLKEYNESDVYILMRLFDIYFNNYLYSAEMDGIPLNMMLSGSNAFQASIFQGVGLHSKGIISDGMNKDRHPEIYRRRKKNKDDPNYQGATVRILKKGFFPTVYKVDVKGMYNAIEIMLNASPETTKILGYKPYQPKFFFEKRGSMIMYHIPDEILDRTVIVGIDQKEDGIIRIKLREIRRQRAEIKKLMKQTSDEVELKKLESQQWGLKVKANIPYGYNGSSIARWGDTAVAIITTAAGRIIINEMIRYITEKYGDVCIEVDTDGIYCSMVIDIDDLNSHIATFSESVFGVPNEIILDPEVFKEGYFISMKNYILYDEHDNLIIHGNSLKSSSMPGCFDNALEALSKCVLRRSEDIKTTINSVLEISECELDDLILSKTLHKSPSEYSRKTLMWKLIEQAVAIGIPVEEGTQLEYIKTLDGYQLAQTVKSTLEIDTVYYQNLISRLITNFGFKSNLQTRSIQDAEEWA